MTGAECEVKLDCKVNGKFCGKCCRQAVVPLLRKDVERLARRLGNIQDYIEWREGVPILKTRQGVCVFLDEEKSTCRVYEDRPLACRLYPLVYSRGEWVHPDPSCPMSARITIENIVRCASIVEGFPEMLEKDWLRPEKKEAQTIPRPQSLRGFSSASQGATRRETPRGR